MVLLKLIKCTDNETEMVRLKRKNKTKTIYTLSIVNSRSHSVGFFENMYYVFSIKIQFTC